MHTRREFVVTSGRDLHSCRCQAAFDTAPSNDESTSVHWKQVISVQRRRTSKTSAIELDKAIVAACIIEIPSGSRIDHPTPLHLRDQLAGMIASAFAKAFRVQAEELEKCCATP